MLKSQAPAGGPDLPDYLLLSESSLLPAGPLLPAMPPLSDSPLLLDSALLLESPCCSMARYCLSIAASVRGLYKGDLEEPRNRRVDEPRTPRSAILRSPKLIRQHLKESSVALKPRSSVGSPVSI
jgi:hypothetical protein